MNQDEAAVRRCLNGDREAFAELVERYKRPLYAAALRLVGDPGLAEDAVQETFLRAYRGLGRFRVGDPLAPWLYRIITNLCYDIGRSRRRQATGGSDGELARQADPGEGPDDALTRSETSRLVQEAITELPDKYRVMVVLAHGQGLSYEEICQATGEPLTIVKNRLFRARQMLKEKLKPYYEGEQVRVSSPAKVAPAKRAQAAASIAPVPVTVEGGVSSEV
ncbi:MAG: RNA polymerase sigma factor [Symbiobacteriia bacterium]